MEPKGTTKQQTTGGSQLTKTAKKFTKFNGSDEMQDDIPKQMLRSSFPRQWERDENIRQISDFWSLSSTLFGRHGALGS